MDKIEWGQISKQTELPLSVFYAYYIENKGKYMTLEEFERTFPVYMQQHSVIPLITATGGVSMFNYKHAIQKIYDYFNGKFNINM